jgi:hypothetical protein
VRAVDLVTVELRGHSGESIDPDDKQLDFPGDIQYDYHDGSPRLVWFHPDSHPRQVIRLLKEPKTYSELLQEKLARGGSEAAHAEALILAPSNPDRKSKVALVNLCRVMLTFYFVQHHQYPTNWNEFARSAFCPIARKRSTR